MQITDLLLIKFSFALNTSQYVVMGLLVNEDRVAPHGFGTHGKRYGNVSSVRATRAQGQHGQRLRIGGRFQARGGRGVQTQRQSS